MSEQQDSSISQDQQMSLIEALVKSGALTPEALQSHVQDNYGDQPPPSQIDPSLLHSIVRHAINPNSVPMQEGDQVHPMDAIQQIGQKMFGPAKPSSIELTGGPQIQNNNGQLTAQVHSSGSPVQNLLGLFGKKMNIPVNTPNYYEAAKAAGIDKLLPSGLPQMPDGTPFVGPETFTKALTAQRTTENPNNPPVSMQDAVTLGIIRPDQYNKLIAQGVQPTDTKPATVWRLATAGRMSGAREGLVALGNNKMEQGMIENMVDHISDATAKGPAAIQANTLNWAVHGRQIASGAYDPQTGQYNLKPQQIAELTMDLNRIMTGSSQVAESARADINAATAEGSLAKLAQYAGINNFNGTTQDLAKMYISMLDRQGSTSNDLLNATLARQIPQGLLLKKINPTAYQAVLDNSFGTHDYRQFLQSLPDAQQTQVPPPVQLGGRGAMPPVPRSRGTGAWRVIR